mmetsp:Transcript_35050/g.88744  ORF Transcript_35050/g.88744 Transcript_35050/m.88744 type:complete len:242 (+) Transcript_35050:435-1160(+)
MPGVRRERTRQGLTHHAAAPPTQALAANLRRSPPSARVHEAPSPASHTAPPHTPVLTPSTCSTSLPQRRPHTLHGGCTRRLSRAPAWPSNYAQHCQLVTRNHTDPSAPQPATAPAAVARLLLPPASQASREHHRAPCLPKQCKRAAPSQTARRAQRPARPCASPPARCAGASPARAPAAAAPRCRPACACCARCPRSRRCRGSPASARTRAPTRCGPAWGGTPGPPCPWAEGRWSTWGSGR